jgi:hypothetical protein
LFTPIICGACSQGRYRPTAQDLYECTECGNSLARNDFDLNADEELICHQGTMHTRLPEAESGLYEVRPTHRVQADYVRAALRRALLRQGLFSGTDEADAANRLEFEAHLSEEGHWFLGRTELRVLVITLRWRRSAGAVADPRHEAITRAITAAYDRATGDIDHG